MRFVRSLVSLSASGSKVTPVWTSTSTSGTRILVVVITLVTLITSTPIRVTSFCFPQVIYHLWGKPEKWPGFCRGCSVCKGHLQSSTAKFYVKVLSFFGLVRFSLFFAQVPQVSYVANGHYMLQLNSMEPLGHAMHVPSVSEVYLGQGTSIWNPRSSI